MHPEKFLRIGPAALPFPPILPPLPSLRNRPRYIQLGDLVERRKLPKQGLGQSPGRNRIWCILALKFGFFGEAKPPLLSPNMRLNEARREFLLFHAVFCVFGE